MCGRYALGIRASFVRHQLQQQGLPVDDAPEDGEVRESYNFAPGYNGLVYRADVPDYGYRDDEDTAPNDENVEDRDEEEGVPERQAQQKATPKKSPKKSPKKNASQKSPSQKPTDSEIHFQLKAMKWGLIPFWTKRNPDYGSLMRTINCRDDSLIENRGMWTTMKLRKRCIVVCQGFYEWLKKGPGGKERMPHFVKRKDGQLMCFAGLWDCAKYEDSEEKLYTYTIITTDSNQQLKFLHDRMPVILEAGSEAMKTWLDPKRTTWSKDLQSLLKPFNGELECYPVNKDVGKVGNNSADFMIPIDSKDNKKNIANFFANAAKSDPKLKSETKVENPTKIKSEIKIEKDEEEHRETKDHSGTEDNAPLPVPPEDSPLKSPPQSGSKRQRSSSSLEDNPPAKTLKQEDSPTKPKPPPIVPNKRSRNALSNNTGAKSASPKKAGDGSQRITNFFTK